MGGRRDDGPARSALPAVPPPPRPRPAPRPVDQPRARLPEPAEPANPGRRMWLAVGLVLAGVATAAVFLTENPLVLRIVLLAVCWAFVVAAFLSGSRTGDQAAAAAREAELRAAYDLELEREVSARHAHEAELESRLRRESEEAMRAELGQLRTQLDALDRLQDDLAAIGRLRGDLDALGQLSARLADLGDLRGELGRLRTEVTEQLSGEVLVERMVMRAQSVRGPAQVGDPFGGRTLEGTPGWAAEPPLRTGAWGVDPRPAPGTGADALAGDVDPALPPVASPPPAEPTRAFAVVDAEQVSRHEPPSPVEWLVGESVLEPWVDPQPRSPREWLDEQSLIGAGDPTGELPAASPADRSAEAWAPAARRHRRAAEPDRDDDLASWTDRLRGTTADEPPASGGSSDGGSTAWSGSWASDGPAYQPPSYGSAPAGEASPDRTPSYGSTPAEEAWPERTPYVPPSYGSTPAEEASPERTPYVPPSYGSRSRDSWSSDEAGSSAYASSEDDGYGTDHAPSPSVAGPSYEPPSWLDRHAPDDAPPTGPIAASRPSSSAGEDRAAADDAPADRASGTGAPPEPTGHARLEQILAESGVARPSGGRSGRRRYREEGQADEDDVLARVLGRD